MEGGQIAPRVYDVLLEPGADRVKDEICPLLNAVSTSVSKFVLRNEVSLRVNPRNSQKVTDKAIESPNEKVDLNAADLHPILRQKQITAVQM